MSLLHFHSVTVRSGCPWSFPPDVAHDKCLPFLRRESRLFCMDTFRCAGVSAWHSAYMQIADQIMPLMQGKEAFGANFSIWENAESAAKTLSSHYWYLCLPPAPSLTCWEGHMHGVTAFLYMVTVEAKMNGKKSSSMFLCLETYWRLEILDDFYCYFFWQQPLNMKYKLKYKPSEEWHLTGDRAERTGVEIQIVYCSYYLST